jgi:thiosulfate dehydrogenase [quinone] large subunit
MNGLERRPAGWWFIGIARIAIGVMWFQQTRWKLPWNNYGGLRYWLQRAAEHPTFGWYKAFLDNLVLPNFNLFGFQVWLGETVIAVTLLLGLFGRLGGLLGGLMSINLLIAMSSVPGEWYWNYIFMALLNFIFFFTRAGRFLGVDQLLAPRFEQAAREGKGIAKLLAWLI